MTLKRKAGRPSKNDSKRIEILEKAKECFLRNGFNKTTLDEIGDALGFNKAALYYYYKNKEELFKNVVTSSLTKFWEELKAKTMAADSFENKIHSYFDLKTDGWLDILKLNGLSRENIIELNESFEETVQYFRKGEVEFLGAIFASQKNKFNQDEINDFLNLLIDVQTDLTVSAMLLNDLEKDVQKMKDTKKLKNIVLSHFLRSFQSGYIPD